MSTAEPLNPSLEPSQLGEGIFCDERTGTIYWVDIKKGVVHIQNAAGQHRTVATPGPVSFVFPFGSDRLLLGLKDGIYEAAAEKFLPIARLDLPAEHRLNDGKCDPSGRLWVGTICTASDRSDTAALYRLDGRELHEVEGGYVNANGKAWSPDGQVMYHADTSRNIIWQYDYNASSGSISNKRAFVRVEDGSPDGLCSDSRGRVLVALYGGSGVAVYSPRGGLVEKIELPVPNVTSCCFGGPELRTLYITTAYDGMEPAEREKYPLAGQVFRAEMSVPGLPAFRPAL
ncbi:SMP-30/gluconolactonase/LRE family protein [Neorhizobium lilium]|uniref:SMP-30/gluconolactonase/LRE family protein n=1 Tax=Neorhizobium lilium TaxID=2503024 RepID=A0A3S3S7S2_9HYPH|nr:SMP-30/gluconolactonase/LRE family protein [Neorhizobium lilium]RWX78972.1 SMP-30/gluconolactonase/LRE family protein [Neorhizobium lilium]